MSNELKGSIERRAAELRRPQYAGFAPQSVHPASLSEPYRAPGRTFNNPTTRRAWIGCGLVIAATTFNAVLCLVDSRGPVISKNEVIASELAIYAVAMLVVFRAVSLQAAVIAALFVAYLCTIWFFGDAVSPIVFRDILIPFLFTLCGMICAEPRDADRLVYFLVLLVLAFAIWEWFWLGSFLQTFNVIKYYIDKGFVGAPKLYSEAGLALNGVRGAAVGRALFPALGPHRVSSLFLEPLSCGYFSVIAFAWLLVRFRTAPLRNFVFMALTLVLIVLSDSRAGAFICAALLIARMLPPFPALVLWLLPFGAIGAIVVFGSTHGAESGPGEGFVERLAWSGHLMANFDLGEWLGISHRMAQLKLDNLDSGYGYMIYTIGVVGLIFLWTVFSVGRDQTVEGARYRTLLALYLLINSSVSGAVFSIKTTALAWFLLGAAQNLNSELRAASPATAYGGRISPRYEQHSRRYRI